MRGLHRHARASGSAKRLAVRLQVLIGALVVNVVWISPHQWREGVTTALYVLLVAAVVVAQHAAPCQYSQWRHVVLTALRIVGCASMRGVWRLSLAILVAQHPDAAEDAAGWRVWVTLLSSSMAAPICMVRAGTARGACRVASALRAHSNPASPRPRPRPAV